MTTETQTTERTPADLTEAELDQAVGGDRCFVKSWSTSGDADDRPTEEVAFYYNRIG